MRLIPVISMEPQQFLIVDTPEPSDPSSAPLPMNFKHDGFVLVSFWAQPYATQEKIKALRKQMGIILLQPHAPASLRVNHGHK